MSTCDVCIGTGDYDQPEFYHVAMPKARRDHKCCECGRTINPGEVYERVRAKWDRRQGPATVRTCAECKEIRDVFSCGEGFLHGELWNAMSEYAFENLTTASECFTDLSSKAKERVLSEWRDWKFS